MDRTVQNVGNLSTLNKMIYSGMLWCERIWMYVSVVKNGHNNGNGGFDSDSYILLPISTQPLKH